MLKENFKLQVDSANDGLEALVKFSKNLEKECCQKRYKLVLMDLNMPVMDGYDSSVQILNQFKKIYPSGINENGDHLHIVAVTAFVNQDNIQKCFTVGMNEVIHKPLSNDALKLVIDKFYFK